jgi:hypothetical protein
MLDRRLMRDELDGAPYWYDEGGNYIRVKPSSDGGIKFWCTEDGFEHGARLRHEEALDIAAHLVKLAGVPLDVAELFETYVQLGRTERERDEWRTEAARANEEVTGLHQQLAEHFADENSAQAANDRLRTELEDLQSAFRLLLAGHLRPDRKKAQRTFAPGDLVRVGQCDGYVTDEQPAPTVRVVLDGAWPAEFPTRFVDRLCNTVTTEGTTGRCRLLAGHETAEHYDGFSWFTVVTGDA